VFVVMMRDVVFLQRRQQMVEGPEPAGIAILSTSASMIEDPYRGLRRLQDNSFLVGESPVRGRHHQRTKWENMTRRRVLDVS